MSNVGYLEVHNTFWSMCHLDIRKGMFDTMSEPCLTHVKLCAWLSGMCRRIGLKWEDTHLSHSLTSAPPSNKCMDLPCQPWNVCNWIIKIRFYCLKCGAKICDVAILSQSETNKLAYTQSALYSAFVSPIKWDEHMLPKTFLYNLRGNYSSLFLYGSHGKVIGIEMATFHQILQFRLLKYNWA